MTEIKIPKDLGACADLLWTTREKRYALQKQVTECEEHESALKEHLINTLPKSKAEGITGKLARATIGRKVVPTVKDWTKFYQYIAKNKAWELLQRRVGEKAVMERWEAGKTVPGVDRFDVITVHLNKR